MGISTGIPEKQVTIREGTFEDLETILHQRRMMFYDMGNRDEAALSAMLATSRPFFASRLRDGMYHAWLAEDASKHVVAGGGLMIFDYHSSPRDPFPRRAMVVNMYTEPAYRRQGIARKLVEIMIDWCRKEGFGSVWLHASDDGRPLYEKLGFRQTNEMRLMLR
jgi:GNAT superfamily N-acetyltransferase